TILCNRILDNPISRGNSQEDVPRTIDRAEAFLRGSAPCLEEGVTAPGIRLGFHLGGDVGDEGEQRTHPSMGTGDDGVRPLAVAGLPRAGTVSIPGGQLTRSPPARAPPHVHDRSGT